VVFLGGRSAIEEPIEERLQAVTGRPALDRVCLSGVGQEIVSGCGVWGWRREWDSNPRGLSACRFSRPVHSTALPSLQTNGESNRAERDAHAEKCVDGVGLYLQVDGLRHAAAVGIFTD
jgi:hypothetical protein